MEKQGGASRGGLLFLAICLCLVALFPPEALAQAGAKPGTAQAPKPAAMVPQTPAWPPASPQPASPSPPSPVSVRQSLPADAWDKALSAWKAGEHWLARAMRIRSEEYRADGSLASWEESELRLSYPEGADKPSAELLRAVKDGRDITEERRGKSSQGGPPGDGFPDPLPFKAENASFLRLSPSQAAPGGFATPYRIEKGRGVEGTLYWSAEGRPQRIEYRYVSLPPFVSSFTGDMSLGSAPDGSLVLRGLSFSGEAAIVFIKKRFSVRMEFSDFKR